MNKEAHGAIARQAGMKTKEEIEAVEAETRDDGDNSLAGWMEVIHQASEESRAREQKRKALLKKELKKLDAENPEFGERVLRLFDIYRTGVLLSTEFCEKVFTLAAQERGISEDEY